MKKGLLLLIFVLFFGCSQIAMFVHSKEVDSFMEIGAKGVDLKLHVVKELRKNRHKELLLEIDKNLIKELQLAKKVKDMLDEGYQSKITEKKIIKIIKDLEEYLNTKKK